MTKDIQQIAGNLVRNDVYTCVSMLISELASPDHENSQLGHQANELYFPVQDWESAARDEGWIENGNNKLVNSEENDGSSYVNNENGFRYICEDHNIEPYENEIFEHWIVSDFLGKELEKRGERVDFDFQGLTIWGRTTTGQAISMDAIIQDIAQDIENKC